MQRDLGITFVHVTHTQLEAIAVADLVVVMEKGKIRQAGRAREVYANPKDRYVAEFLGGQNLLSGRVQTTNGQHALVAAPAGSGIKVPLTPGIYVVAGDLLPADKGVDKNSHGDFPSSSVNFCAALSIRVATFARTSVQASTMSSLLSIVFRKSKIWASERSRSLSSNWNWRRCSASSRLRATISSGLAWRSAGFLRATIRSMILS
jgi:ABC-type sugar transport system ATPase subunit